MKTNINSYIMNQTGAALLDRHPRTSRPAQTAVLSAGEQLFAQDDLCGGAGYILTRGSFELTRPNHPAEIVGSPNLLGVMPRFDPDRRWSATAIARETAELLRFSWLEYEAMLQRRLSQREQQELGDAIAANAAAHFVA